MEREGVRLGQLEQPAAVVDTLPAVQLGSAQVGEKGDIRRQTAELEARSVGLLEEDPARPEAHGQALLLRDLGQDLVEAGGLSGPAGHAGDQDRRSERAPEEGGRRRHLGKVELGQRQRVEAEALEPRAHVSADFAGQVDTQVLGFARGCGRARFRLRLPVPDEELLCC